MITAVAQLFGATVASATGDLLTQSLQPLLLSIIGIASVVAAFFLIIGGFQYMTSNGNPDKLVHAKQIIRNALIGLVIIISAGTVTTVLRSSYSQANTNPVQSFPKLETVEPKNDGISLTEILVKAITGFFKYIVESAAKPFIKALDYFTKSTPLIAENQAVFKLWLAMVGIVDALFVLVLVLLGFHFMSASVLGFNELELKQLLPQTALTFLLINTSIFIIDAVISISNFMITALASTFATTSVFTTLAEVADKAGGMGLVALMVLVVFMILSVILLVYYISRMVVLYLGAVLAPLVFLLLLVPGFKDFAISAIKAYLTTIFVLFVHVVILLLAASILAGMLVSGVVDPIMSSVLGVATLLTILKTQGLMQQLSMVSTGSRGMRKLGGQFINGVSSMSTTVRTNVTKVQAAKQASPKARVTEA